MNLKGFYVDTCIYLNLWKKEVGSVFNDKEDSVKKVREIRKKLSKERKVLEELNNFGKL